MTNTPSDAEIEKLAAEHLKAFAQFTGAGDVWVEGEVAFARAVLAKWGTPKQEAQEPVAVPRFNCWSTNEGDSWFDHPADSQAIYDCLGNDAKVGDEYELTAGWTSVTARYRITEVVGDGEEYEVECISHPHENSAPNPAPAPLSDDTERLEWLLWKLPGDALRYVVGELADTSSGSEFRAAIDAALAAQGITQKVGD